MHLIMQTQTLQTGAEGSVWKRNSQVVEVEKAAILISDMWDRHWSAGATARAAILAQQIDSFVKRCRALGCVIIHAPSDTMDFYQDHPARRHALEVPPDSSPVEALPLPPKPIDDSDGGSDTSEPPEQVNRQVWTRQNEDIAICEGDYIVGDEGARVAAILDREQVQHLIYVGVHLNFCILHTRSFSMLPMKARGFSVGFVRDLVDSMYNPARPPYVSHETGTQLVADFIEKFVCPSIEVIR